MFGKDQAANLHTQGGAVVEIDLGDRRHRHTALADSGPGRREGRAVAGDSADADHDGSYHGNANPNDDLSCMAVGSGRLAERVALVTGASRGIGRASALALAAEGAAVAVNYRSEAARAAEVVAEIEAGGGRAQSFAADVGDAADAARLVERVIAEMGGLHILVNNAGITRDGLLFQLEADAWVEVMRVNFGGVFHCTKAVIDHFAGQGGGVIVNVSSTMGEKGWTGVSNYAASKGAVNAFTRAAAVELARFGIRVNGVLAGLTETEMVGEVTAADGGRRITKYIPVSRAARPDEIGAAVAMLAGVENGYITGTFITVDGGALATLGPGRPF